MAKLSLVAASLLVAGSLASSARRRAGRARPAALRMGLADDIKATVGANDGPCGRKSTCPFCKRTKASLADLGIAAKIIEARARARASASIARARRRRRRRAAARRPRRVSCRVCARLSRDRHRARVFRSSTRLMRAPRSRRRSWRSPASARLHAFIKGGISAVTTTCRPPSRGKQDMLSETSTRRRPEGGLHK